MLVIFRKKNLLNKFKDPDRLIRSINKIGSHDKNGDKIAPIELNFSLATPFSTSLMLKELSTEKAKRCVIIKIIHIRIGVNYGTVPIMSISSFFLGLPLPLFSGASTFLLISLLVDACTTFSASLSIVFLFFFVGITVTCGVSSSTSVIFRFRTLIELTTLSSLSASDWYPSAFLDLHGLPLLGFCPITTCLASIGILTSFIFAANQLLDTHYQTFQYFDKT
ncbi:hypothetical protein BpHYR1_001520 [Brachionus plicatilis]|uniref:Uncharacterized protein n=1 Tax=Brachionus plicatilis TaxID=10195 RepID=A0A3M7P983_BRAPC|nr:hypothetical protein BpHYR1_001520 [Brachionus plicatilis]